MIASAYGPVSYGKITAFGFELLNVSSNESIRSK